MVKKYIMWTDIDICPQYVIVEKCLQMYFLK